MSNFEYRFAKPGDEAIILQFINALAEYENMSDLVVSNEALINEWIFQKGVAEVIFALENGKEVGFALFFKNYSTFVGKAGLYLEDLFVYPEHRGKGYGKNLIKTLVKIAVDRNYGRMEWSCLNWNKPSIDFYLSLGAKPMDEWTVYRLDGDVLSNFANGN